MFRWPRLILVALGLLAGMSASAWADSFVRCPLREVNSAIVDSLPAGWEVVPSTVPLTDTRVDGSRRPDRLQCVYGDAGILEMRAPRREACEAVRAGFRCRSLPREPSVVAEGVLRVPQGYTFDLDTGRLATGPRADLWLQAENFVQQFLATVGSAQIARMAANQPGYQDCERAPYGTGRIPIFELLGSGWVCYATESGRFGRLRVAGISFFPMTADIAYTTWE